MLSLNITREIAYQCIQSPWIIHKPSSHECLIHPEVDLADDLVQQFARDSAHTRFPSIWMPGLTRCKAANLPPLQSFAAGVQKDKDAVRAGLTWRDQ